MKLNDRTLTVITAACLAVGVGAASFFLRSDDIGVHETAAYQPNVLIEPSQDQQVMAVSTSSKPIAVQSAAILAKPAVKVFAALTPAPQEPVTPQFNAHIPAGLCNINLQAKPKHAARVLLNIVAQCHPGTEIKIEHAGLRFRELLDANGELSLIIPAFAEFAKFDVTLRDGSTASTAAFITGLSSLHRAGISWQGKDIASLHAYESSGHVSRDMPRSYNYALLEGGGYMTVLGNPSLPQPSLAQVYTSPVSGFQQQKFIKLAVEIQRADSTCDSKMNIQTAQHNPQAGWSKSRLNINLTECGTGAGRLVLNNVVKNMRMAQNE